jgi:hypothetical protein
MLLGIEWRITVAMTSASTRFAPLVMMLLSAAAGLRSSAQIPPSSPSNPLAIFAPLVGADWVAELQGGQVTDTQRYEWTLDRKFIRNTHQVRTNDGQVVYEGETIYAWDSRGDRIVWWYWNTTGGYVTGTVTVAPDGTLVVEGDNHGPKDQLDRTRVRIRISSDAWTSAGSQERDGKWTDLPLRTYRRMSR